MTDFHTSLDAAIAKQLERPEPILVPGSARRTLLAALFVLTVLAAFVGVVAWEQVAR